MREQGEAVLTQLSRVMRHAGSKGNIQRRDDEERLDMIVDSNDTIFERVVSTKTFRYGSTWE